MAYSALPAKTSGCTITLANYDTIRDNFAAGFPDLVTTKGDILGGTAVNAGARLGVGADDSTLVPASGETTGLAWQIQPAARVHNSANIAISAQTWTTLTFDSERYDTDASHSTVSSTSRLTVPTNGDGIYTAGASVSFGTLPSEADNVIAMRLLLNGATQIGKIKVTGQDTGLAGELTANWDYSLAATDYLEIQVFCDLAVNIVQNANFSPEFWYHYVRRP